MGSVEQKKVLPKYYILSDFHPGAVKHAQSLMDCVLYGDPECDNWRQNATAILIKDVWITEKDLEAAPKLRVIGKQGVGLDMIDVEACKRRGIKICNVPGANASAVAEMTLSLALAVSRDLPNIVIRQRINGEAIRKEEVRGTLLSGRTLGIVGMGNIGQAVARMFSGALGCPILAYDPYYNPPAGQGPWEKIPHRRITDINELITESDVLTIHIPLTKESKDLICYEQMKKMKRTAILLNLSRGGIVNEEDLVRVLEEELIWGAGFDAHAQEPPTVAKYERLWNCKRFIGTPHIAAATEETQLATINPATDGVYKFLMENY